MLNYIPDFNRLLVFCFVFQSGSITGASEQLHLTKSAVSQSIKLLEEETGETLFVRTGRTLTPTNAAMSLFEIIEPFYDAIVERYSPDARGLGPSGLIRISAPPFFGSRYVLPCISEFKKLHPRVRFQVNLTASITPLKLLEDDQIDFCIVDSLEIMFGNRSHFLVRELIVDPEYIVCSRSYWKTHFGRMPTYSQILETDFISYHPNGAEICYWLETTYGQSPQSLEPALVVDTPDIMLFVVKENMGMGLVPVSMAEKEIKKGKIVSVGGKKSIYQNSITLVSLREKRESTAQSLFVDHLLRKIHGE